MVFVFDVSLEMQSDSKNYVRLQDDAGNIRAWAYHKIGMSLCLTLKKFTLTSAVRDIYRIGAKTSFKPNEKMRYSLK